MDLGEEVHSFLASCNHGERMVKIAYGVRALIGHVREYKSWDKNIGETIPEVFITVLITML